MLTMTLALAFWGTLANPQDARYDEDTLVFDIPASWDIGSPETLEWEYALERTDIKARLTVKRARPAISTPRALAEAAFDKLFKDETLSVSSTAIGDYDACYEYRPNPAEARKRRDGGRVNRVCFRLMPESRATLVEFRGSWPAASDRTARKDFAAIVRSARME